MGNPRRTHRRAPARRRTTAANPRHHRRRSTARNAYTYDPATHSRKYYTPRRRRRNPVTARKAELREALKTGLATGLGMVAVRSLSNVLLKTQTGYMKALGDAGIGIAAGIAAGAAKLDPMLQAALIAGGASSATLRLIEIATAGKFSGYVSVGDYMTSRQANQLVGEYYRQLSGYVPGSLSGPEDNVPVGDIFASPYQSAF